MQSCLLSAPQALEPAQLASASHAARTHHANDAIAARTTKLQWFVLNPLEELLMSQRARLVLDEGD